MKSPKAAELFWFASIQRKIINKFQTPMARISAKTIMENTQEKTELTFGQKAVGLNFNPSGDDKVGQVKQSFADLIDTCDAIKAESYLANTFKGMAIRSCILAQMAVVKSLTWKD
jgi:hypothetical protein